jgi:hypothetical protein
VDEMIYISLEKGGMKILDRRRIYYSLPLIMPLVLAINKIVTSLYKELNVDCNVYVRIGSSINLEVKND